MISQQDKERAARFAETYSPKELVDVARKAYEAGFLQGTECSRSQADPSRILAHMFAAALDLRDAVNEYHRDKTQNAADEVERLVGKFNRPLEAWEAESNRT